MLWTALGGVCQIGATALMLAAMRERSFVVTIAYTKTEPIQIALFAFLISASSEPRARRRHAHRDRGVIALSWPTQKGGEIFSWRPATFGIVSGGSSPSPQSGFAAASPPSPRRISFPPRR